jgi:hypothetical protein
MHRRGDAGGAIGELAFITSRPGPASTAEVEHTDDDLPELPAAAAAPPGDALPEQPHVAASVSALPTRRRRTRQAADESLVRAELLIPAEVTVRAKALTRPQQTGAQRTLGAAFLLQAYVRALDELALPIDMNGLDLGTEEEAVARVLDALHRWRGDI